MQATADCKESINCDNDRRMLFLEATQKICTQIDYWPQHEGVDTRCVHRLAADCCGIQFDPGHYGCISDEESKSFYKLSLIWLEKYRKRLHEKQYKTIWTTVADIRAAAGCWAQMTLSGIDARYPVLVVDRSRTRVDGFPGGISDILHYVDAIWSIDGQKLLELANYGGRGLAPSKRDVDRSVANMALAMLAVSFLLCVLRIYCLVALEHSYRAHEYDLFLASSILNACTFGAFVCGADDYARALRILYAHLRDVLSVFLGGCLIVAILLATLLPTACIFVPS